MTYLEIDEEFKESLKVIEENKASYDMGYNDGLNDAWEMARKIFAMSDNDFDDAFGDVYKEDVFCYYTPQEALAKLKAYEEQSKIEVGDVVEIKDGVEGILSGIVTRVSEDYISCVLSDGKGGYIPIGLCKKTGKHIDIESILEQIRGE